MSKERILSHQFSQRLSISDLEGVSAAGMTTYMTAHASGQSGSGVDYQVDITVDF
jgi:hypothetical protein